MTIVGRSKIDHPALGTAGGSALHASIETIYTNIGDHLSGRYRTAAAVANSAVTTLEHNYGVQFADLKVMLYTGSHPNLTRVADPVASGWVIAATTGQEKTHIDVTAPSSGGPHTFAVFIVHAKEYNASATQVGLVSTGAQTFAGAKTFQGALVIGPASGVAEHIIRGDAVGNYTLTIQATNASAGAAQSNGLVINAGITASDIPFIVNNRAANTTFGFVNGVGTWEIGNSSTPTHDVNTDRGIFRLGGSIVSSANNVIRNDANSGAGAYYEVAENGTIRWSLGSDTGSGAFNIKQGGSGGSIFVEVNSVGACTFGPTSGGTLTHTFQSNASTILLVSGTNGDASLFLNGNNSSVHSSGIGFLSDGSARWTLLTGQSYTSFGGGPDHFSFLNASLATTATCSQAGAWTFPLIHNVGAGNITSGIYTPTASNEVNCTVLALQAQYIRVGNVVHVSGVINIDATSGGSTLTSVELTLPVASNFSQSQDCAGVMVDGEAGSTCGSVKGEISNDRAKLNFLAVSTSNNEVNYTYSYVIK